MTHSAQVGAHLSPGPAVGDTPLSQRLPGPDLARGGMLLLIALANVHVFTFGHLPGFRGYPLDQSVLDHVFTAAQMVLVDGRAFPLFAALFGYGLVQVAGRHAAAEPGRTVRLLRRRGWWMVAIGFAHAIVLFTADIVALYGLLAVALAGVVVRGSDRRLLVVAGWLAVPALAFGAARGLSASTLGLTDVVRASPVLWDGDPLGALGGRLTEWGSGILRIMGLGPAVLLGAWAARKQVFGTTRLRPVLRRVAVVGLAVGVAGGVPSALMAATVWPEPPTAVAAAAGALHLASGYAVAAAYVALFALLGSRIRPPVGPVVGAVMHSGQRSLTLYLAQSVVFLAVLDPTLGGLGDTFGVALCSAIAVGAWLVCVAMAATMHRVGVRGPAETFLRAVTYR
jgi:uncharacterized protein